MKIYVLNRLERSLTKYEEWLGKHKDIILINRKKHAEEYSDFSNNVVFDTFNFSPFYYIQENIDPCEENYIIGTTEWDLIPLGELRSRFSLKGQTYEGAIKFRDKVVMKDYVSQIMKTPSYKRLKSILDVKDFIDLHGYPIVIKPVDGAGSLNTHIIKDEEQLHTVLNKSWGKDLMVETFIDGEMFHVDGVYHNNQLLISRPSKYINGCLAYKENKYLGSVMIDKEHPLYNIMNRYTKEVLNQLVDNDELPITFHAEFFYTYNNEVVFNEIASRVGGGRVVDAVEHVTGVNLIEAWVRTQSGQEIDIGDRNRELAGWVLIPPPYKGKIKKVLNVEYPDQVIFKDIYIEDGQEVKDPTISIECAGAFALKGKDFEEIEKIIIKVNELFLSSLIYE